MSEHSFPRYIDILMNDAFMQLYCLIIELKCISFAKRLEFIETEFVDKQTVTSQSYVL